MTKKSSLLTKSKTDKSVFSGQTSPNIYQSLNRLTNPKAYVSTNRGGLAGGIPPPQPPQTTTTTTTSTTTLAPTTTSTTTAAPTSTTTSTTTIAPTTTTSTTSTTTIAPTTTTSTTTAAPTTTSTTTLAPTTTSTTTIAPTTTSTTTIAPTTTTSTTTLAPTTTTSTTTAAPTTTTSTTSTSTTNNTPTTCPPISNTIRLATLADVGVIPNASVGDLIVFGPNDGTGLFIKNINSPIASLVPGAKILIRGGYSYDFIEINSNLAGTLANPIVITNFCGQVETESFGVVGMSHFKLTSKYDPANKTGDINYQGHAAGYAWSQGKYGIYINNRWANTNEKLLYINSGIPIGTSVVSRTDNYEVEYIESGNGGYSNLFKWDYNDPEASNLGYPTAVVLDNIRIHDNYFHDLAGEGLYMGYFDAGKTGYEVFENLKVYNNRAIRCGRESFQIKRFGPGTEIYNNVGVNTGMGCLDGQNFATVLWNVNGNTSTNNNLFVGNSGYATIQWYVVNSPSYTPLATTASFVNNAMLLMGVDETAITGIRGMFIKSEDQIAPLLAPPYTLSVPPIAQEISNNYWGFFDTEAQYANLSLVDNNNYAVSVSSPIFARNNTYTQKTSFWSGTAPTVSTNNVSGSVNDVSFVNFSYGVDFDWSRFRYWANEVNLKNYTPGWYVSHKSKIYKAIANSSNVEPGVTAGWQTYWELKTYNGGTSFYPADDIRVSSGNFYNTNNIGLVDKP